MCRSHLNHAAVAAARSIVRNPIHAASVPHPQTVAILAFAVCFHARLRERFDHRSRQALAIQEGQHEACQLRPARKHGPRRPVRNVIGKWPHNLRSLFAGRVVTERQRIGHGQRRSECGSLHAKPLEDDFVHGIGERFSRDPFDNVAGQPVAGIRVGIDRARLGEEPRIVPAENARAECGIIVRTKHHGGVLEPGGVAQELMQGQSSDGRWQVGDVTTDGLIELDLAGNLKQSQRRSNEHLGGRAQAEKHFRTHGVASLDIGHTERTGIDHAVVLHHYNDCAGRVGLLKFGGSDFFEFPKVRLRPRV